MGYELLEAVVGILTAAGIRAGEEYPAGERMEILSPAAAVGLRELDTDAGAARFTVRVLSPRILGGWCCQVWAARAAAALHGAGLSCSAGEMEYRSGSNCFCVTLDAEWPVVMADGAWTPGQRWQVLCGDAVQEGVASFRAVRDQGRRVVGAFCRSDPVAVTPGSGGWALELVQWVLREPADTEEPFVLTVREGTRTHRYTGCCWNEVYYEHTQRGLCLTRRGFALGREVLEDG